MDDPPAFDEIKMAPFRLCWMTRGLIAAAIALPMTLTTSASAAVIGIFDPAFGSAIPNLGFRGSIQLEVSSGCYASGAASGIAFNGTNNCTVTVDFAQILFYNSTLNTPNNVLSTVNLPGSFFSPTYVESMSFDADDHFAGMNTEDSALFDVNVSDPNETSPGSSSPGNASINYSGDMYLFFYDIASEEDPAVLVNCPNASVVPGTRTLVCNDPQQASNPATVAFSSTDVSEPGTEALAVVGLGALALRRRHRRALNTYR